MFSRYEVFGGVAWGRQLNVRPDIDFQRRGEGPKKILLAGDHTWSAESRN